MKAEYYLFCFHWQTFVRFPYGTISFDLLIISIRIDNVDFHSKQQNSEFFLINRRIFGQAQIGLEESHFT